jgi:hypothetical protein
MATINASTNDGYCGSGVQSSWKVARSTSGAVYDSNNTRDNQAVTTVVLRGGARAIRRAFFDFDTSGISVAPTSAYLNIFGYSASVADIIIVRSEQSTSLAAADFNNIYNSSTELGNSDGGGSGTLAGVSGLAYSGEVPTWSVSGYNAILLNAQARSDMASLSTFKVCMMSYDFDYLDIENSLFTVSIGNYWAEDTSSKHPYIDYTSAAVADNAIFFGHNF